MNRTLSFKSRVLITAILVIILAGVIFQHLWVLRPLPEVDSFDSAPYDGEFDSRIWHAYQSNPTTTLAQKDGVLTIAHTTRDEQAAGLNFNRFDPGSITTPVVYEASLNLIAAPDPYGNIQMHIWFNDVAIECKIDRPQDQDAVAMCHVWITGQMPHMTPTLPVSYGTWHRFRIDFDPTQMRCIFTIDGNQVDDYTIPDREAPTTPVYTVGVGAWGGKLEGKIDDVSFTRR